MTIFTDLDAALEELEWLVENTGRTHLIKHHTRGRYKVIREYISSDDGKIIARLAPKRDYQALTMQKVIGRAA